ncbi:GDSL-type esterase/lipase family protein [Dyella sp.]|jgi:acyl-CoA thioesterase-1|uniref:GDSL-type esterase/lipase family protein n=1 Tax=Dyella sp. TaxID=1869338 RepID=UPI002D7941DA|nr:GDSL-type esterase/lipase family protein [Dyella sp.]HET6432364.1 GDSL-type esterase/lipase family protein [Dyella sp.]
MRSIVTALLAAVLASSVAPVTAATAQPATTVLLVGDSLSSAHRIPTEAGWVTLLQHRLDSGPDRGTVVVNASRGGKTLADAQAELPGLLARHHPQVVVLELGANDAILGASASELRQRMVGLIDMAKASGARVAVLGFEVPAQLDRDGVAHMLHQSYAEVARQEQVALLPSLMAGVSDHPALLLDDGIHPTAAAQAIMLDNAWPTLKPLLSD